MSAMDKMLENLVTTVLKSMDIDVETLKATVTTHIANFERNVQAMNDTLAAHQKSLERIEIRIASVQEKLGLPITPPTASKEKKHVNGNDPGGRLPPAEG